MALDFEKLEKPTRRRKRSVFSEKFLGRDAILQVRVTASEKQQLQWLANHRGEPLATMLSINATKLARVSAALQEKLTEEKIDLDNLFAIETIITIGNVELREWKPCFKKCIIDGKQYFGVSIGDRAHDAYISKYANVWHELARIFGDLLPCNLNEFMARHQPELGCSIEQAIREFQNKKVDRFVRKLEKERKTALSVKAKGSS